MMAVSRWQTVEDGAPRDVPYEEIRAFGTTAEHKFIALPIRNPVTYGLSSVHLVLRASRVTGVITARPEPFYRDEDDGA
jgi:hypothetical protein